MRTDTLTSRDSSFAPDGPDPDGIRSTMRGARRWWMLGVCGAVAVVAALVWGLNATAGMVDEVDGWARAAAPGAVEVAVDEPGRMVVRSESSGFVRWGPPQSGLEVSVTGPDGVAVAVEDAAGVGQYRAPGRTGRAVAVFETEASGNYRVTVDGPEGATFAVGEPLWPEGVGGVVGATVLGLAGLLAVAGGAVGVIVSRDHRHAASTSPGQTAPTRGRRRVRRSRMATEGSGLGRIAVYAVLAIGATWAVWIPALTLLGEQAVPFVLLGGFGPAVAAAVMVRAEGGRVRTWLRDIFRFRLPARWYAVALALPLLEPVTVTIVAAAHGMPVSVGELPGRLPAVLVGFVVVLLIGGGQEEAGWRGYLLPRLQARIGALGASLAIGLLWAVWHLPLFTLGMSGYTYEHVSFFAYVPMVMAASVAFTWLFNRTGGSVVPVMLLHAAFNSWDNLTPLPASTQLDSQVETLAQVAITGGYALVALALVMAAGRRLGARPADHVRTLEGHARNGEAGA